MIMLENADHIVARLRELQRHIRHAVIATFSLSGFDSFFDRVSLLLRQ